MKQKSLFDKFKDYFTHANSFKESNPRMAYIIKLYAANSIHNQYKQNSSLLNETEKGLLQNEVRDLKTIKVEGDKPSVEEYSDFIENIFANVNEEDRFGTVTMKTAKSFKTVAELIGVFAYFGDIQTEWKEKGKYFIKY